MEPESLTDADVSAVLATLPRLREDLEWTVGQRGGSKSGRLVWVRAVIPQGTVSTPDHLLLFDGRTYLGTATAEPRPYTRVIADGDDTVTVEYRWIVADEPFAAPAGRGTVRYQLTADGTLTALDPPPWPSSY